MAGLLYFSASDVLRMGMGNLLHCFMEQVIATLIGSYRFQECSRWNRSKDSLRVAEIIQIRHGGNKGMLHPREGLRGSREDSFSDEDKRSTGCYIVLEQWLNYSCLLELAVA